MHLAERSSFFPHVLLPSVFLAVVFLLSLNTWPVSAQGPEEGKPQGGPPPASVVVGEARSGFLAPEVEFVGTVYYDEVSEVSAEVGGVVREVLVRDGERVSSGAPLVRLDTDILEKEIASVRASYRQSRAELERAVKEFRRVKDLFKKDLASEQSYDNARFTALGLKNRAASLKAQLEGLDVELNKKTIPAPFEGVVIETLVDRGEFLDPGAVVATTATDRLLEVVVNVPENTARVVKPGSEVKVRSAGVELRGKVETVIPRGDVSTRSFPVKISAENTAGLIEGMEARAVLPTGDKLEAILVPRDAVIPKFGRNVVFTVKDSKASMVPVEVVGYSGLVAGVRSPALKPGASVVTKGNERLNDGQPVRVGPQGGGGRPGS